MAPVSADPGLGRVRGGDRRGWLCRGTLLGRSWRESCLRDQLAEDSWQHVLARWWPRLIPGTAAAAAHGIIRTSHAARSLAAAQTSERVCELARGLAYWAAGYLEIPGSSRTADRLDLEAAIGGLPVAARPVPPGLITARLRTSLAGQAGFPAAVSALRTPSDVPAGLLELATTSARIFLICGRTQPIEFLHAVTAPVAVPEPLPVTAPPPAGELADHAIGTGDVHAIKLTEACLRLHSESAGPMLLHAAARACQLPG